MRLTTVFEYDRWLPTPAPVYILDDLHRTGAVLGARGPCDRACALMWHQDWLHVEPETATRPEPATPQAAGSADHRRG